MAENYTGKVAAVVIPQTDKNLEFLIAKRSDNGDWEFPGGKQHRDETILETAEREIEEELGIKINAEKASKQHSYRSGGYDIIPIFAEIVEEDFTVELVDHTDYRWLRPEALGEINVELENEKKCLKAFSFL
jgi:8-oxo-dGTP diphosphatase